MKQPRQIRKIFKSKPTIEGAGCAKYQFSFNSLLCWKARSRTNEITLYAKKPSIISKLSIGEYTSACYTHQRMYIVKYIAIK